jgi:protein-disulfide isomerase
VQVTASLRCSLVVCLTLVVAWLQPIGHAVAADAKPDETLAEVNGERITSKDIERGAGAKLATLEEQLYTLKREELDNLIAQKLLAQEAARRDMSVTALVDTEVTSKVGLVTEQEVEAFYQANKERLRGEESALRENIRAHLQQQKLLTQRLRFVQSLRAKSNVTVRLPAPPVIRVEVSTEGAPVRGAKDAPVTLVEFSDFQCPFCKQAEPTVKRLLERYPDKLKLVYRDFPLEGIHPQARPAAEAARCAADQGKFWEYHDVLYASNLGGAPDEYRRYAEKVGLDVPKFDECVKSGTHRAGVQRDLQEGSRLGVTGTPAFFVNGRPLQGAQPLEAFVKVIEDELRGR